MTSDGETVTRRGQLREEWRAWPGWARFLLVAAVAGLLLAAAGLVAKVVGDSRMESGAVEACQGFVEDQLKSPASAEFTEVETTQRGEYGFDVHGAVDSQNGFGAMVRNDYWCSVNEVGDDWMLIDLQFDTRG